MKGMLDLFSQIESNEGIGAHNEVQCEASDIDIERAEINDREQSLHQRQHAIGQQALFFADLVSTGDEGAHDGVDQHQQKMAEHYARADQINDYFGHPGEAGVTANYGVDQRDTIAQSISDLEQMRQYMIDNCAGLERQIAAYDESVDRADDLGYPRPEPGSVELARYISAGELQYNLMRLLSRVESN